MMQTANPTTDLSVAERIDALLADGWFDTKRRIPQIQEFCGFDQADTQRVIAALNHRIEQGKIVRSHDSGLFYFHRIAAREIAECEMMSLLMRGWFGQPRTMSELMAATQGYDQCAVLDTYIKWLSAGLNAWETRGLLHRWTGRDGQGYFSTKGCTELVSEGLYTEHMLPLDIAKRFKNQQLCRG